jgi:hypothetical protein
MRRAVLAAVFLVLAGGLLIAQMQTPPAQQGQQAAQPLKLPASPPGQSATQVGGKWVQPKPDAEPRYTGGKWIVVDYGRPILRGRKNIFGAGADYGQKVNAGAPVWRAGANVTTRLHTEVPLVLGGKTLPAGDYSLFVELKPAAWTLIVSNQPYQQKYDPNNKTDTWGSYNYDPKFDVMRVPMKVGTTTPSVDQFTIDFLNVTDAGGTLAMRWEATMATVDFKVG